MAEIDYREDYGGFVGADTGLDFGRWMNISGAIVSLALIGGLSIWGYKLLIRDVTGVPVVQAMEGAFRVSPEDPGGLRTPHQGLAVNEIAAVGEAAGPVDEVRLAPPPDTLAEEDRTSTELEPLTTRGGDSMMNPGGPPEAASVEASISEPMVEPVSRPVDDDLSDALATDRAIAEALAVPGDGAPSARDGVVRDGGAFAVSPRPQPRPARRDVASTPASEEPAGVSSTANNGSTDNSEVDVASLEIGTRLVQLGAFPSGEMARAEWEKIAGRFPDYFDGKRRVIQKAESGGNAFYRLRAEGFADLADTRRFCTALVAGQTDCIPVELR